MEPGAGTFDTPRLVLENFGVKQEWSPAKHIRVMADLNADNFPDIVGFGDGGVWTALGNGDGTFQNAQFPLDYFACKGRFDFNVESTQTDVNGFPLNPLWRWQLYNPAPGTPLTKDTGTPQAASCHYFTAWTNPLDPAHPFPVEPPPAVSSQAFPSFSDCTDQTDKTNVPGGWNGFICGKNPDVFGFPGHANWFTATFATTPGSSPPSLGLFSFGGHNFWDDDYDNSMYIYYGVSPHVVQGYPAMMNDRDSQHAEFDSDETIDYFNTPWWNYFHSVVSPGWGTGVITSGGLTPAQSLMHDAESIVTGMFGVDCEHDGCKSEIHPVFTLAVHVLDSPDNDTWAMFLRNTGDEGYCSSQIETANFTSYTFRLPWRTKESIPWNTVDVLWGPSYPACAQSPVAQLNRVSNSRSRQAARPDQRLPT